MVTFSTKGSLWAVAHIAGSLLRHELFQAQPKLTEPGMGVPTEANHLEPQPSPGPEVLPSCQPDISKKVESHPEQQLVSAYHGISRPA